MKAAQLEKFRDLLKTELAGVQSRLGEHYKVLTTPPSNKDFVGGDRAQELELQEADETIVESEEQLALKIERALAAIENGSYGICEGCGCEIPLPRLEAKPSVSLCISCQEKHEAG